jgi:hypothetical protein
MRSGSLWNKTLRLLLIAQAMAIAAPCLAQTPDTFQSAPGPEAPKPRPRPHVPPPAAAPAPAPTLAPAPSAASAASASERVYNRYAPSGADTGIIEERHWDHNNCTGGSVEIRIVEPPRSGTATVKEELLRIPSTNREGVASAACTGRTVLGKSIYYQSQAGFHGTDRLAYLVSMNGGEWHRFAVEVTVQ